MICRVNSFFDALNEQNSYDAFVKYSKGLIAQLMFCLHRRSTDKKQLHIYLHPEKNSNDMLGLDSEHRNAPNWFI